MAKQNKLNLDRKNIKTEGVKKVQTPQSPEEAARLMAEYNQAMYDMAMSQCNTLIHIAETLAYMETTMSDMLHYQKEIALKTGLLTEQMIDEREGEEQDLPDSEENEGGVPA